MGRRPIGRKALTGTQRQRRWRAGKKKAQAAALHMARIERLSEDARAAGAKVSAELAASRRLFPVICADPPWHFETYSDKGMSRHAARHYATMSTDAICAIVPPAAPDCGLFLWVPPSMANDAMRVIKAWDFVRVSCFYWHKIGARGHGYYSVENQVEELWMCRRGRYVAPLMGTQMPQMIPQPRGEHSEKPQVFYDHIARLHPGCDLLDMFTRIRRPGWWSYGDELPEMLMPPTERE
jgi:N6-adenosine-specific RNA methylase IME4